MASANAWGIAIGETYPERLSLGVICEVEMKGEAFAWLVWKRNMANLKEVAKLAGVSIATASLALRGGGNIRESTRIRVMTCAERLSYTPTKSGGR